MRTLTIHHDGHGLNESIDVRADDLGPGGASHRYTAEIGIDNAQERAAVSRVLTVHFQEGPRNLPTSHPGVTEAVLLGILIDRLRCFQAGPYACRENAIQLTKLEECLHWQRARADERAARGVLGTYAK